MWITLFFPLYDEGKLTSFVFKSFEYQIGDVSNCPHTGVCHDPSEHSSGDFGKGLVVFLDRWQKYKFPKKPQKNFKGPN